jgi:hypothetical protein
MSHEIARIVNVSRKLKFDARAILDIYIARKTEKA